MNAFGVLVVLTLQRLSSVMCINHGVYPKDVKYSLSRDSKAVTMNAFDACLWLKRYDFLPVDTGQGEHPLALIAGLF